MQRSQFLTTSANITKEIDKKNPGNKDSDIILYILIVVGASIFLLMIPLLSYIVQLSKRRMRKKRRRKHLERVNARRMAERDILEKMIHESRKESTSSGPQLVINSSTQVLEIPPRSPIHPFTSPPHSLDSHSRSPVDEQKAGIGEIEYNLNGLVKEQGLINRGYYSSSSSIVSIPLRKAASDLYLSRDPTLLYSTAKRRFSEDIIGNRGAPAVIDGPRRNTIASPNKNIQKLEGSGLRESAIVEESTTSENERINDNEALKTENDQEEESGSLQMQNDDKEKKGSEQINLGQEEQEEDGMKRRSSIDSTSKVTTRQTDSSVFDSDWDYDDICDDVYENVNRNSSARDEDGPIYDVVEGSQENDLQHIYSNVDEVSDTESHIYWNVEGLHDEVKKSSEEESEGDEYENIEYINRNFDGEDSDTSIVSYENLDFLDGRENEMEEARMKEENDELPPIIPRRKPILDAVNKRTDIASTNWKTDAYA